MTPFLGMYPEYNDFYKDEPLSLEEIQTFLCHFSSVHILQILCKINMSLWKSSGDFVELKDLEVNLISLLFPKEEIDEINKYLEAQKKGFTILFHRHQILLAIKLILLGKENKSIDPITPSEMKTIGKHLIALSSYLQEKPTSFGMGIIDTEDFEYTRQASARLEYFSHKSNFVNNMSRALQLWLDTAKRADVIKKAGIKSFKLEDEFLDATGLTLEEYITRTFLFLGKIFTLDPKTAKPEDFVISKTFLSLTALSKSKKEALEKLLMQDQKEFKINYEDSIKEKLGGKDIFVSNFLPLVDFPILRLNENISVITDPQFLEDKITAGIYWILLNNFNKKYGQKSPQSSDLSKLFGFMHQYYTYEILSVLCDEVIEIKEREGLRTCDCIGVIKRDDIIFLIPVECKKIALKLPVLFLSDKESTLKNLEKIFGEKGFGQIYSTLKMLASLGELKHIDLKKVVMIYPLLITDRLIAEESLNRNFYEKHFFNLLDKSSINYAYTREIFMSIEDLEVIESALQNGTPNPLLNFLDSRISALNNRFYRYQRQFIPGMRLEDIGEIVKDLFSMRNDLYLVGFLKFVNFRLKKFFDTYMIKARKELFPGVKSL